MKELVKIQSELKAPKGQFNSFGGYKYRSCEDILEAVKPLLAETGCVLILTDTLEVKGDWHYVTAHARLINSEGVTIETEGHAREEATKKGMDASQITGSASSYARKYALNGLFCIDDTRDADATNTHGKDKSATPTFDEILEINDPLYTPIAQAVENASTPEELKKIYADNLGLFSVQSDATAAVIRNKLIEKGKKL